MNITLKVADAIKLIEKRKTKAVDEAVKKNASIDADFASACKSFGRKLAKDAATLERLEANGTAPRSNPESHYESWPKRRRKEVANTERYDSAIALLRVISDESVTINLTRDKSGIAAVLEEAIG